MYAYMNTYSYSYICVCVCVYKQFSCACIYACMYLYVHVILNLRFINLTIHKIALNLISFPPFARNIIYLDSHVHVYFTFIL